MHSEDRYAISTYTDGFQHRILVLAQLKQISEVTEVGASKCYRFGKLLYV